MKFERLGNIIDIRKGKKPSFVDAPDKNSVRVLQIDDLRNDDKLKFTNDKTGVLANETDVLIAWDGANAGTIGYGKSGFIGSTIALLRKKQPELYSTPFLGVFLQSQYEYLRSKSTGATIPHTSRKALEELKIPVIDIGQQNHIANLLSKAGNLIVQRKESISLLDEFLKTTFLEMFGNPALNKRKWNTLTLKELSLRFSDGPFGSNLKTEHYADNGVQVIRLQNIGINEFVEKDISYVKQVHYENVLKKYSCFPGDIVIATMGDPNIRACIVPKHIDVAVNKADCVLFRVNPKLTNQYYISQLLNLEGFLFLAASFIHGQTRARISSGQLAKISIPVPPIKLQTQFAQIVKKTEALKTQYQQSLQELENLYGSLSQRAFKGELSLNQQEAEKASMVVEPASTIRESSIPEKKRGFAKQVLGGKIVSLFKDDKNFTHIKFQKLQYLAEHIAEEDLLWNYYRQQAGPYDNKFMHNVANKLKQNKWFEEKKYKFYPLQKVSDIDRYYSNYFSAKETKLSELFTLLKNASEKVCEAISTIYAVWNNHIILKQSFDKNKIRTEFFEWSNRKGMLFTEDEFEKALAWMQKHNIAPSGFGQLIKEKINPK